MKEAGGETLELDRGRTRRLMTLQHEKPDDEEAIFLILALHVRGTKQGKCCPWLGGRHLHGSLEGLRNLLMVK